MKRMPTDGISAAAGILNPIFVAFKFQSARSFMRCSPLATA